MMKAIVAVSTFLGVPLHFYYILDSKSKSTFIILLPCPMSAF